VHRVGDGYVDRRSHVRADGLGRVPAIFATRTEKRQCVLYQVTRYIGAPSKSTPSVANAAVAVSIRPLVAIAQGISACVR